MNLGEASAGKGTSGDDTTLGAARDAGPDFMMSVEHETEAQSDEPEQVTGATILIVDDHPITHSGLQLLFSNQPQFCIVGGLHQGTDVSSYLATRPVDLVILDLNMPDIRGVSVLAEIIGSRDMTVVVLTGESNVAEIDFALKLGARAVVSKSEPANEILAACDAVLAGEIYVSPKIERALGRKEELPVSLSPRQMAILHYLEQGHSNKEIGYRLSIAPPTVSFHIAELRKKLGVEQNRKIVERAQTLDLI